MTEFLKIDETLDFLSEYKQKKYTNADLMDFVNSSGDYIQPYFFYEGLLTLIGKDWDEEDYLRGDLKEMVVGYSYFSGYLMPNSFIYDRIVKSRDQTFKVGEVFPFHYYSLYDVFLSKEAMSKYDEVKYLAIKYFDYNNLPESITFDVQFGKKIDIPNALIQKSPFNESGYSPANDLLDVRRDDLFFCIDELKYVLANPDRFKLDLIAFSYLEEGITEEEAQAKINSLGYDYTVDDLLDFDKNTIISPKKNPSSNSSAPVFTQRLPNKLEIINEKKRLAKEEAVKVARQLWENDVKEEIKITAMSDKVYKALIESHIEALPQNIESINRWIKHVAPDYAKLGGRPKK